MNLLVVDPGGFALDISLRALRGGHKVKHFIRQTPKTDKIGRGYVELVDDWREWFMWADLVFVSDNQRYVEQLDRLRADPLAPPVLAPSVAAAEWELDRELGQDVLREAGIAVMPSQLFNDYDAAIAWVKQRPVRWVSKPCGSDDKSLSYVSKGPADMVYMLERWKAAGKLKGPFLLQEHVAGIEMAVGGWHGPGGFVPGWCENFEFKKLMDGDLGVATGEQGTVLHYVRRSELARRILAPLAPRLRHLGYIGYIDVNTIIDDNGTPWPLEFTMRPGWPTLQIQQELHVGDGTQWLMDLAMGRLSTSHFHYDRIAVGVCLSIPDYPYSHLTRKLVAGVPVYGVTDGLEPHLHPCEMMLATAPCERAGTIEPQIMPCTAGDYVLVMSASGLSVQQAARRAYRRLNRLSVPNSPMWRTDIGQRLSHQLPRLQSMGYATEMRYTLPTS